MCIIKTLQKNSETISVEPFKVIAFCAAVAAIIFLFPAKFIYNADSSSGIGLVNIPYCEVKVVS